MSYDMWFQCPCCSKVIQEHNMTYNYAPLLKKVFGEEGIRSLYGHTAKVVAAKCYDAIGELNADKGLNDGDGWDCTEGNLCRSLSDLRDKAIYVDEQTSGARSIFLEGD